MKCLNKDSIMTVLYDNCLYVKECYYKAGDNDKWDTCAIAYAMYRGRKLIIKLYNNTVIINRRMGKQSKNNYAYIDYYSDYDQLDELISMEMEEFYSVAREEINEQKKQSEQETSPI